jgi:penicillin-binding protein 1A
MPLTSALARSINSIPVRMSLEIGKGNAKAGRRVIIDLAGQMGLSHPLQDSSSLPIGAGEVTVLDMTASYAVFANGGRKSTPYATWEVRNAQGDVIYRHDRDAPQPQVLQTRVVQDMNFMLNKVVEEGTGKRALLDGIRAAGKTGTTNGYRDAWFVGYTGNLVTGVWFGNDDHTSTKNMTGGTLPAMAWKEVMAFAHQNLEIRPIPGVQDSGPAVAFASGRSPASAPANAQPAAPQLAPGTLSRRSFEVIDGIGDLFRRVERPDPAAALDPSRGAGREPAAGQRVAMP